MQVPVSELTQHQELLSGKHLAVLTLQSMDKHRARLLKSVLVHNGSFKIDEEWLKHYAIVSIGHDTCMCNIDPTPAWRRRVDRHA